MHKFEKTNEITYICNVFTISLYEFIQMWHYRNRLFRYLPKHLKICYVHYTRKNKKTNTKTIIAC